jgi:hypothetical protein
MQATISRFPDRPSNVVWLTRDGPAWLVLANGNGWVHGSSRAADDDARWVAGNLGLPVRETAARSSS